MKPEWKIGRIKTAGAGFTLVELLAVIAIAGMLAALQVAALTGTRNSAQTVCCLNNMEQLQLCWQMYANENSDLLPLNGPAGPSGPGGNGSSASWTQGNAQTDPALPFIANGALYPYNKSMGIYTCPANTRKITFAANPPIHWSSWQGPQARTVSMNYVLGGVTASGSDLLLTGVHPVLKYSEICSPNPKPDKMFVFADENEFSVDDGDFCIYPAGSSKNQWWNLPGSRHNKGTTWSFADGHVEYWKWHGTAVLTFTAYYQGADNSDDLARVQACTSPLGN